MKTAGELLRDKRLLKELTLEDVATKTKIKLEYLEAIENSDFTKLPSSTFANYASFLYLNPDTIVAMFRRDFMENEKGEIIPRGLVTPLGVKPKFFTVSMILIGIATLAFLGFLILQLVSWWSLPKLKLIQPKDGETYGEKVTIKGIADPDASVSINGQKVILDRNGQFSLDLILSSGTQSVIVESVNRLGKATSLNRTFTVSK